jgi:hypothetical protein
VLLIRGGNEWIDGNFQIRVRWEGQGLTPPSTRFHPKAAAAAAQSRPAGHGSWESPPGPRLHDPAGRGSARSRQPCRGEGGALKYRRCESSRGVFVLRYLSRNSSLFLAGCIAKRTRGLFRSARTGSAHSLEFNILGVFTGICSDRRILVFC